jgi:hypothetical protein
MSMKEELAKGVKEEAEHAPTYTWLQGYLRDYGELPDSELLFLHIAMDHLAKDRGYYTKLGQIE